jgi:hypothetical protein
MYECIQPQETAERCELRWQDYRILLQHTSPVNFTNHPGHRICSLNFFNVCVMICCKLYNLVHFESESS